MIIYEAHVEGAPEASPIREESIRIFRCESGAAALATAEAVGRRNEHSYPNEHGEVVTWRFMRVVEVQDLCEETLGDGVEVFSRMTSALDRAAAADE